MKEIVILSGKGGTGKTSIAMSIANELSKRYKIIVVDADADCPNDYLLFDGKERNVKELYISEKAVIKDECKDCEKCKNACQFNAIRKVDGKYKVIEEFCEGCGACKVVCPEGIDIVKRKTATIKILDTGKFPLIYTRLEIGMSTSGKVVSDMKSIARDMAKEMNADLIIVDSSAGIGCPVIAAVTGANYAIGIVEPSKISLNSLMRSLEVVEHFRVPYGIVINKFGLSSEYSGIISERLKDIIIGKVNYDPKVPRMIANRKIPFNENDIKPILYKIEEDVLKNE